MRVFMIGSFALALATSITLTLLPSASNAATVSSSMNTLPSAEGWTLTSSVPEGDVFSVAGGLLHQNTIGQICCSTGDSQIYEMPGIVNNTDDAQIRFRARVLQWEGSTSAQSFAVTIDTGAQRFSLNVAPNEIYLNDQLVDGTIDNTVFHEYTLNASPSTGEATALVDGTPIGTISAIVGNANRIWFGDGTGGGNAEGEWDYLVFSQPIVTVPALRPWSLVLLALLMGGLFYDVLRRQDRFEVGYKS